MNARTTLGAGLLALLLAGAGSVAAQDNQAQAGPGMQQADTMQLMFDREVFRYPAHARRNPFRPLGRGDVGPSFEDLVLMGTIVTDVSGDGVALIGLRGSGTGTARNLTSAVTHRLRTGQRIGNTRILEIQYRQVLVEVEEFGLTERRVMEVVRTEPRADGDEGDDSPPAQGDTMNPPPDTVPPAGGSGGGSAGAGVSGTGADDHVGSNGNGGT